MKKYVLDLRVTENLALHTHYVLLKATSPDGSKLPEMLPGQFAELRVDGSPTTFLRRPISVNFVDVKRNEVWFLIQLVGDGTRRLSTLKSGDVLNAVLPLGNSFSLPEKNEKVLFIGLPCQVAALKQYIDLYKLNRNLLTLVDIVCHGVTPQDYLKTHIENI